MTTPDNGMAEQGGSSAQPPSNNAAPAGATPSGAAPAGAAPPAGRPILTKVERDHVYRRKPATPTPKAPAKLELGVEETARVVQLAYSVIGDNIKQGRDAAEKLRQGQYHISAAPADLDKAGRRVLGLARELSSTTMDLGERLLGEMRDILGPVERGESVPAFRALVGKAAVSANMMAVSPPLKLTVRFDGDANAKEKGKARTTSLERPKLDTQPEQIRVKKLESLSSGVELDADVTFKVDLTREGLVAEIKVNKPQNGVFSGIVYIENQDVSLGVLTIEIPK